MWRNANLQRQTNKLAFAKEDKLADNPHLIPPSLFAGSPKMTNCPADVTSSKKN